MARLKKTKRKPRNTNKRRKGFLATLIPWAQRSGLIIIPLILTLWLSTWLIMGGQAHQAADWAYTKYAALTANAGFKLGNILVEGRTHSETDTIMALINMQKGAPLAGFNPHEAQSQIEKMAWVSAAHVERRWPDTIYINLTERQPLALLALNKKLFLLDTDGEIIHTDRLNRFAHLITTSGQNAQEKIPSLVNHLKNYEPLHTNTKSASYISSRRWDITLKNNIKIMLPENDIKQALETLSTAHNDTQILDKDIQHIDLRDPNKMMIRTKPGQVQNYKASFKSGNNI